MHSEADVRFSFDSSQIATSESDVDNLSNMSSARTFPDTARASVHSHGSFLQHVPHPPSQSPQKATNLAMIGSETPPALTKTNSTEEVFAVCSSRSALSRPPPPTDSPSSTNSELSTDAEKTDSAVENGKSIVDELFKLPRSHATDVLEREAQEKGTGLSANRLAGRTEAPAPLIPTTSELAAMIFRSELIALYRKCDSDLALFLERCVRGLRDTGRRDITFNREGNGAVLVVTQSRAYTPDLSRACMRTKVDATTDATRMLPKDPGQGLRRIQGELFQAKERLEEHMAETESICAQEYGETAKTDADAGPLPLLPPAYCDSSVRICPLHLNLGRETLTTGFNRQHWVETRGNENRTKSAQQLIATISGTLSTSHKRRRNNPRANALMQQKKSTLVQNIFRECDEINRQHQYDNRTLIDNTGRRESERYYR